MNAPVTALLQNRLNALPANALPVHDAYDLTKSMGQAHILLSGQVYTLRITKAGKLILTK
ncbi:MAG: hemin uptake protein HemP [Paracoccaceae bacterium]